MSGPGSIQEQEREPPQQPAVGKKTMFGVKGPTDALISEELTYTVTVTDENGTKKSIDQSKLEGFLMGKANVPCSISTSATGLYDFSCVVRSPGKYHFEVLYNGQKLFPQPMEIEVTAERNMPTLNFFLEGDGLHNGRIGENQSFVIKVQANGSPVDMI